VAATAAKTGLLDLARALAAEIGPFGIRADMVVPRTMDTERRHAEWYPEFRQASPGAPEQLEQIPLGRLVRPEEIAEACVFLAFDASACITADEIRLTGGRVGGGPPDPAPVLRAGYLGQIHPVPLGLWKQPTDCGSSCFGSHSTTSGNSTVKAMVTRKTT